MRHHLLSEQLLNEIEPQSREDQAQWLFLTASEEFKGRWSVEGLWPDWFLDFEDIVGHYRTVSPATLDAFMEHAESGGYRVCFEEPPEAILSAFEALTEPPPFHLHSTLENTVNGFLAWQTQGFNKLVRDEDIKGGLAVWDTGTGKTAFIAAAIKWHETQGHPYDIALVVVKKHNKTATQRKLLQLADIESYIVDGSRKRRDNLYADIFAHLSMPGTKAVVITNYEKFREDEEVFQALVGGRDCLFFWDEMPTRLSNRSTQVYKAVQRCLWDPFAPKEIGLAGATPRPAWMRQWELTATPIENSPEGVFNCIRLMNPPLLGWVKEFEKEYVSYHNPISFKPEKWKHLDRLEGKIEHMTHRVSRLDPEVAKMFPEIMEDPLIIDWDPRDRAIYDKITGKAAKLIEEENMFEEENVLSLIQVCQMVCDAPSMLNLSADNREEFIAFLDADPENTEDEWHKPRGSNIATTLLDFLGKPLTNDHHTKFDTLEEILFDKHPNEKVLVYMTWSAYGFQPLQHKLDSWNVSYVTYQGTDRQKQAAQDSFRQLDGPRVFLSSDAGSDSIDLPEAAVGVNYNLPWTWTRKRQRQGRNNRVDSSLSVNWWYDLIMANSVELRKADILATKRGYHEALFDKAAADDSMSAKLTREDLLYILGVTV